MNHRANRSRLWTKLLIWLVVQTPIVWFSVMTAAASRIKVDLTFPWEQQVRAQLRYKPQAFTDAAVMTALPLVFLLITLPLAIHRTKENRKGLSGMLVAFGVSCLCVLPTWGLINIAATDTQLALDSWGKGSFPYDQIDYLVFNSWPGMLVGFALSVAILAIGTRGKNKYAAMRRTLTFTLTFLSVAFMLGLGRAVVMHIRDRGYDEYNHTVLATLAVSAIAISYAVALSLAISVIHRRRRETLPHQEQPKS